MNDLVEIPRWLLWLLFGGSGRFVIGVAVLLRGWWLIEHDHDEEWL